MNTIKGFFINFIFALVVMAFSFMIMPLVSFASDNPGYREIQSAYSVPITYESLVAPWNLSWNYAQYNNSGVMTSSGSNILSPNGLNYERVLIYSPNGGGSTSNVVAWRNNDFYLPNNLSQGSLSGFSRVTSYQYPLYTYNWQGNIPIFDCTLQDVYGNGSMGHNHPAYLWLTQGVLSDTLNVEGH